VTALTTEELQVLYALQLGVKRKADLEPFAHEAFDSLVAKRMIEPVYVLTERAHKLMKASERNKRSGKR